MRMKHSIPKQFIVLEGLPILMHTLLAFYHYSKETAIYLGLPQEEFDRWNKLCAAYHFEVPFTLVSGGNSRFQTVKNCLHAIPDKKGIVAVHDGVRPLVDNALIGRAYQEAKRNHSAVASLPLKESLRKIDHTTSRSVDRAQFVTIQTPQTFDLEKLKQAYTIAEQSWMTDDASVFEAAGFPIILINGSYRNIKVTTPDDLTVAQSFLRNNNM